MTDRELGGELLTLARCAISAHFGWARSVDSGHPALLEPAATFVTLKARGELRGCIGSIEARRPLGVDVRENAVAAAFRDPRFPPLAAAELDGTSIEVSLLSKPERLDAVDEEHLIGCLQPGVDGVVLEVDGHRATFLPQVWETIADPTEFLGALKRKAGLSGDFWSPRVRVSRYRVSKWTDRGHAVRDER